MTSPVVVGSDDLALYLDLDPATVDDTRAAYLLDLAVGLCQSVVSPLPAGSEAVILDVAARGFTNPLNVTQDTVGPSSTSFGRGGGGLYLTRANERTLRRLSGSGGAFTIDVMPATAGQNLPPWAVADGTSSVLPAWDTPL